MKYAESVIDLVGDTPLVRLRHVTGDVQATVLVKLEYLNPGGSAKDRIARRIIEAAEAEGRLRPGGTIVEPTSGNTGVGLALVAQQRGYHCVFVLPDKVGEDKINVLKAYGADVVLTPTTVAPESPDSYYSVSDRIAAELPGAYKPNQYANLNGPRSHYETTGPEIWRDTDGRVTNFVAGVGTGGTISGAGRYLKDVSGGAVRVVGADPEGSVYSGGSVRPYLVEGVGEEFWPGAYDPGVVDEVIAVSDADSFAMARRLAEEEGLLVGGSSGMAVVTALRAAQGLGPDDVVVVLLPDGGRGYLGTIFNDRWMRTRGFATAASGPTTGGVLRRRGAQAARLPHVRPEDTVAVAVARLVEHGLPGLPVLEAEPPVVLGEVAGAVSRRDLLDRLLAGEVAGEDPVTALTGPPLPLVGVGEPVADARDALAEAEAVLVVDAGRPVAVLTAHDLLTYVGT